MTLQEVISEIMQISHFAVAILAEISGGGGGGCSSGTICICLHYMLFEMYIIFWFRKKAMMVLHWQWGHWRLPGPLVNNISMTMSSSYFSQWLTQIWHVEHFDAEKKHWHAQFIAWNMKIYLPFLSNLDTEMDAEIRMNLCRTQSSVTHEYSRPWVLRPYGFESQWT